MPGQISRRTFSLLAIGGVIAACGEASSDSSSSLITADTRAAGTNPDIVAPVGIALADREPSGSVPEPAGRGVTEFGLALFADLVQTVGGTENVSYSPLSVALALAMVEPGAIGDAQTQLRNLLRIDDPALFHAGMNALEQSLESRQPTNRSGDGEGDPGEVIVRIANAVYVERGFALDDQYLDTVGRNYGPVLNEADFSTEPDAVAVEINRFVAESTNDRITELLAPGAIDPDTVLALVNALFLKASWESPFDSDRTDDANFTTLNGDSVNIPMMHGQSSTSASGDGWVGASKNYVGDLVAQFVLLDDGRFGDVATVLADAFGELSKPNNNGTDFAMPRFETRLNTTLDAPLQSQGLTAPYAPGGLIGIADDARLVIDSIAHETFVAFDENGTEAAAATVVLMMLVSAPLDPIPVTLDRPFYYRIMDRATNATLFLGQVTNPAT